MYLKILSSLLLIGLCLGAMAQKQKKTLTKEINFFSENDNYDFDLSDRYYTNGLLLQYNWLGKSKPGKKHLKKINRTELAQRIYNPYKNNKSLAIVLQNMDRPFAGWLNAQYGHTLVYPKGDVLIYDANLGVMGPASGGEQVQKGWHSMLGLYRLYGWENQVHNALGLGINTSYYRSLAASRSVTLHIATRAMVGTLFNNASAGLLFKTGRLSKEHESGFWNSNLGVEKPATGKGEWIFFLQPMIQVQASNATVEGNLFSADKGPYTTGIKNIVGQLQTGIYITGNRMGFKTAYTFRTAEGSQMKQGEHWGSFALTYRFR